MKKTKQKQAGQASNLAKNTISALHQHKIAVCQKANVQILALSKISQPPKISLIIPVYNAAQYLRQCLTGVIQQSLKNIEIICIDDGSTDESLQILRQYAARDNRITVLQQKNAGAGAARNLGINCADGEFIAFMDADDFYPDSEVLHTLYRTARKHNVLICGGSVQQLQDKRIVSDASALETGYVFTADGLISYSDYQFDYGYWRFIYQRQFLIENQLYFPDYLRGQDPPFFIKAMILAQNFYALQRPTYVYRVAHKTLIWNERKLTDFFRSTRDCLLLSKQHNLTRLHCKIAAHLHYKVIQEALRQLPHNLIVANAVYETLQALDTQKFPLTQLPDIYARYQHLPQPQISVLMTAYNAQDYIAEAIESILQQTFQDFEFIIVNDGSTDDTANIIQHYAQQDSRIRFINNSLNRGLIAVLNQGLELCRGEYIARMDADDISTPERFAKQIQYLQQHPEVGILSGWLQYFPHNHTSTIAHHKEIVRYSDVLRGWCINHGTVMMRKSLIDEYKLRYNPDFPHSEDYELWSRAIRYTQIHNLPEVIYLYRKHGNSVCDTHREQQKQNTAIIQKSMLQWLAGHAKYPEMRDYIHYLLADKNYTFSEIPVVIAANNNYASAVATCLYSILEKTAAFISCFVLSDGISPKNIHKIRQSLHRFNNFHLEFVDMQKFNLQRFPNISYYSTSAFSRYFIPEICADYDKVVYTDADVIFNGDIAAYFNLDLHNCGIAATAEEIGAPRGGKFNHAYRKKLFGINPRHKYFANGNLIISCDYWRKHNITEQLIAKTAELADRLVCPDLDVMNIIFQNNYTELPFKYCATVHRYTQTAGNPEMAAGYQKPFIIHYSGAHKPWNTANVPFFKEFNCIYNKTAFAEKHLPHWLAYVLFPYYLAANYLLRGKIQNLYNRHLNNEHDLLYTLKLFSFLPIISTKRNCNRCVWKIFGLPLLLIKNIAGGKTKKYYVCGLPLCKLSKKLL